MSGEVDKNQHILPNDSPVVYLEATAAFNGLTEKEKLYAYHLSQASWVGGLVTLIQTSAESAPLFVLLHKLFLAQKPADLKAGALKAGLTEDEVTALLIYTAGVFSNSGNYKSFGDSKIIPGLEKDKFEVVLKQSPVWDELKSIWEQLNKSLYDLSPGRTVLGFPPHGCTTYFSKNCTQEDDDKVEKWMKSKGLECWNTRCFKTETDGKVEYEIRLAGENVGEIENEVVDGIKYRLVKGDYSPLMGTVAQHLKNAIPHTANQNQSQMLEKYVGSFVSGSLQDHKEGSRLWIKDKSPAVETYIGFIETYRDPAGVRGEFEAFVSAVNRPMSEKFAVLVNNAEKLLPLLPWSKGFEKDKFLRPDFTSLDVLTFAGSGIPAGINIPNYDDIRQTEGFKNVSLGNVIPASYQQSNTPFLNEEDKKLLEKYRVPSFEVQVGLHELLGHGSGKLFRKEKDGSVNYPPTLLNPLTGDAISSHYEPGDTYDSKFGPLSSAYEECRAEAVGLYLSLDASVLKIFGHEGEQESDDVMYVNWLSLVWAGLNSLEMWDPNRGWLQAHSQARFALTNVLIQAGVVTVSQPADDDLLITLDRTGFKGAGRNAVGYFLLQLQVLKATANVAEAQKLFKHFTDVKGPWVNYRNIVLANKRPRKMFTQPNMVLNDEKVTLKNYESSPIGLIDSWIDRFNDAGKLHSALLEISKNDAHHF
ncbi:PREDICTED: dipeptidyl peptidase 3 [Nicrophorus vespilloides]|uniref:Dipeptidyl peptidase 3 n=1 Tax=Nicrophorus vespilloides TaxID=110193 RepID=A0ABM1N5A7_NICVS|nr:PREDICTED: dipeptidyl peptidase 3 [Nicrophorus vespilloides]